MANNTHKRIIALGVNGGSIIFRTLRDAASHFMVSDSSIRRLIYSGKPFNGYCFDYVLEAYDD